SGAPQWAPATAIIKAINAVPFILVVRNTNHKIITKWTVLMTVVSGLWSIGGYLLAEGLMYSFPSALTSVPFTCIQAVGSAIVFVIVGAILDKIKIQKYI
ncbi:MAG: ECF transporter S component, partial [Clostridia bacterium]|nr:ECF transporter S component [Clostridia bacterium]